LSQIADTKAAKDVTVMKEFFNVLSENPDRAFYGIGHIKAAIEMEAVEKLLITDELFRAKNVDDRKKYVELVERVRESQGEVLIFSSLHSSGEQLSKMSGIAAILRFPMPELDVDEESNNSESDNKK